MIKRNLLLFGLIFMIGLAFFNLSNELPIFQWDESRLGVSAIEMLKSHDFIVTTYGGEADNWNTKPPFAIWLMCLSLKVLGYSELSLRIPAILFSIFTLIFVTYILRREKVINYNFSLLYFIILTTSIGFSGYHVAITADYDAILVFFFTVFCISSFFFISHLGNESIKAKFYGYIAIFAFTLGVFTKGIAIGLTLPAIFVYLIFSKKSKFILNRNILPLLFFFTISLVTILGYYFLRNYYSPNYLASVFKNEMGGRFNDINENHIGSFYFYLGNIFTGRFSIWIYLLFLFPLAFIKRINTDEIIKRFSVFNLLIIVFFIFIISSAKTKLQWYDAPIYPILAIQILINIYVLFNHLKNSRLIIIALIFLISTVSIYQIANYYIGLLKLNSWPVENNAVLLKDYVEMNQPNQVNIISYGYQSHLDLYKLLLKEKGINLLRYTYEDLPQKSDLIYLTSDSECMNKIKSYYLFSILDSSINGYVFRINGINSIKIKEYINVEKANVLKNREWMDDIVKKAKFNAISVDEQIVNDIIYVSENGNKIINNAIKYSILSER